MIPVPHDIPLPLPAPELFLKLLLVVSFLVHIGFVNLMVGSSIMVSYYQWKGRKRPGFDKFAHLLAATVTVNKSMAVVLGVAPLLLINTIYTIYFYTANTLTGHAWIMLVPTVTVAFLITYLHKYTWEFSKKHWGLHWGLSIIANLLFLSIPLIFLANTNLMLFPNKWVEIQGFFSALLLPNVFARYLHFLAASLSLTGLFIVGYFGRKGFKRETELPELTRSALIKQGYSLALGASALQFLIGPLVLFSMPSIGLSGKLLVVIFLGAALAAPAVWLIWKELSGKDEFIGRHFWPICLCLGITVLMMGSGRHFYRDTALASHQSLMKSHTANYLLKTKQAQDEAELLEKENQAMPLDMRGAQIFKQSCSGCHGPDKRIVGPPVTEMKTIYYKNSDGLIAWIKAPGKKRKDYPQMPSFGHLTPQELNALKSFILK